MNIDKWLNTKIDNDIIPYHENYYHDREYYLLDSTNDKINDTTDNTNKYHVETLFRQMIDYSGVNNFNYTIYNCDKEDYIDCNLLEVTLRDSFYKFCYDHSTKPVQLPSRPIPIKKI